MLSLDVLRVSTRSFKNNRLRTMLTVLGISIGIGTIFFLVSLGYGFQKLILEKIATEDSLLSLDVTQKNESIKLNEKSISAIKEIGEVSSIFPLVSQDSQVSGNGLTSSARVNIVNANFFKLEGTYADSGELFSENENDRAVVSTAALQLLNIEKESFQDVEITVRLAKGKAIEENQTSAQEGSVPKEKIIYKEITYRISGVIDDLSSAYLYIPDSSASEMNFNAYDKLKIKVSSTNDLEKTRNAIIEKGFYVSSVSETVEQAKQIFAIAQIVLVLFGMVALIVSAIGMFNTMTIALLERTQEIGIMKTIGASVYDIWKMFLTESMMIGFFGGLFGVIMGYIMSKIINFAINWLATMFGGTKVELFSILPWFIVFVIAFSTIVGLITGFYPARRAAKLNALEALRYK